MKKTHIIKQGLERMDLVELANGERYYVMFDDKVASALYEAYLIKHDDPSTIVPLSIYNSFLECPSDSSRDIIEVYTYRYGQFGLLQHALECKKKNDILEGFKLVWYRTEYISALKDEKEELEKERRKLQSKINGVDTKLNIINVKIRNYAKFIELE